MRPARPHVLPDVNNDGYLDAIIRNSQSVEVHVNLNGNGTFVLAEPFNIRSNTNYADYILDLHVEGEHRHFFRAWACVFA